MALTLYIDGVENGDLVVRRLKASYVEPWQAELCWPGRHDAALGVGLWQAVRIEDEGGAVRFRGEITEVRPGGVSDEGIVFVAKGKRFRLENEPVRINGRGFYVWNRRGAECEEGMGGYDSPGRDGGKWTAGEIALDILEHALGLPEGGSDISGHHSSPCCILNTYLTDDDVAGYAAADWLGVDTVVGEFAVDDTSVADALDLLLGMAGGFRGWYVDPATGELALVDLDGLPAASIQAGELGRWQDAAGTDYRLLANHLEASLDGVASTIVVQGRDRVAEEMPENIEGSGNDGKGCRGELELLAAPWGEWGAAYRAKCQSRRTPTGKWIDWPESNYTPPQGSVSGTHLPRVYKGTGPGPKYVFTDPSGIYPRWLLPRGAEMGIVAFHDDPRPGLGYGEKLWGWYWAQVPFYVAAGPGGEAHAEYGYRRVRTVYDPAFRHPESWPQRGTEDDIHAMQVLARRLLDLYGRVRRQGSLQCDGVDFDAHSLLSRYNVTNLTPGGPLAWETLQINAVEVTWDLEEMATELHVANTFFMLEGYSELKRRLEMNLFVQRELNLSEAIYECQTHAPFAEDATTEQGWTTGAPATTTESPTTAAPNNPPVANDDAYECGYESEIAVPAATGVLANDTDPDGDTLYAVLSRYPRYGELDLNYDGSFSYRAPRDFCGSDFFEYCAYDGQAYSATAAQVVITVVDCPTTTAEPTTPGGGTTEAPTTKGPTTEPATTEEPATSTTAAPTTSTTGGPGTTTTSEPTTTTTPAPQPCPSDCSGCAGTLYAEISGVYCGHAGAISGTARWDREGPSDGCSWTYSGGLSNGYAGGIGCSSSQWEVLVSHSGGGQCDYRMDNTDGCPTGTYDLHGSTNCEDCMSEIDVYS